MRGYCLAALVVAVLSTPSPAVAQSPLEQARAYQQQARIAELRAAASEVIAQESDPGALAAAAVLLDQAAARNRLDSYKRAVAAAPDSPAAQSARRRLVLLHLEAGEQQEALTALEEYRRHGGSDVISPRSQVPSPQSSLELEQGYIEIPGPLSGFQRMAAVGPATGPDTLLLALARNIVTFGYQYSQSRQRVLPTEYLKLLKAYIVHARVLRALAGKDGILRASNCQEAAPLLQAIGYRVRGGCGAGVRRLEAGAEPVLPQSPASSPQPIVEAQNPPRAFLTSDSGFPLIELEEAIQGKKPFEYSLKPIRVPVLFGPAAWVEPKLAGQPSRRVAAAPQQPPDTWIDDFVADPELARLYLAVSQLDTSTAELLYHSAGLRKLRPTAPVLDFFGPSMYVKDGRAVVPGGDAASETWKQLAGAGPERPATFFAALLQKDAGWLAAWFEALARLGPTAQAYFTEPSRLVRFYRALRGKSPVPGPARPVFRSSGQLMLLTSRLRFSADKPPEQSRRARGPSPPTPYLPGGVNTWKAVFHMRPPRLPGEKKAQEPATPQTLDQVVEGLLSRVRDTEPSGGLNVFLAINEIDYRRVSPLDPNTILLLAAQYPRFSQHYHLFADWPQLSDATIERTIDTLEALGEIHDAMARSDALGSFQAALALWEILARQKEIPEGDLDGSFNRLLGPYEGVANSERVFLAAREALGVLLSFAPAGPLSVQEKMIGMLAAPPGIPEEAQAVRDEVVARIRAGLDAQRLVPLDALLELANQLETAARTGVRPGADFVRLAAPIRRLNLPNLFPTDTEKHAAYFGQWAEQHIMAERETDLARVAQRENIEKLRQARGLLAPHLRDTLVGLVYAYYAPPGSALLLNNPLFVRAHDFLGISSRGTGNEIWGPGRVSGTGWPLSAGGRFIGSLSGIAYALADAEKDFLVPQQTQSLIWGELAPQVLLGSSLPRWWLVSARTQHWLALNLRLGRDLLAEAAVTPEAQRAVLDALVLPPRRLEQVESELRQTRVSEACRLVTPAELYELARKSVASPTPQGPSPPWDLRPGTWNRDALRAAAMRAGPLAALIRQMERDYPAEASDAAVSAAFGVPHPKLARSYQPELLHLPLFPTLMGYSSRLLAETWESSNLYWAELADELALHPSELNRIAPRLTRRMLERVFANHLEDWPALLAAMLATGDEFRAQQLLEAQ
jgi:hypothetical protein